MTSTKTDPRLRNETLKSANLADFMQSYADCLGKAVRGIDFALVQSAIDALTKTTTAGRRVYSIGNGGSAAIADHLCCDFTKGTHCQGFSPLRSYSLCSNGPVYSAISNDFGFEVVFERQLEMLAEPGDVLVAVSSSGNSQNIVKAVEYAKDNDILVIGFTGFDGGWLQQNADIALHVPVNNYGIVEDAHQAIMHIIAQVIGGRRDGKYAW